MMKIPATLILLIVCLTVSGQIFRNKKNNSYKADTVFAKNYDAKKPLTFYPGTYIHTEARYLDTDGVVVVIQNSLPKGGEYVDPNGNRSGYRIFWNRIINETNKPIEVTISFPAHSIASPDSYLKLFLPPDTMKLEKETLYDYGATGLKSFMDTGLLMPTMLKRTINPREDFLFYIGVLSSEGGVARSQLVLKDQKLYYNIKGLGNDLENALIPCGQIRIVPK